MTLVAAFAPQNTSSFGAAGPAVAIKGDAIVAGGTNRVVRPLASSSTRVIDLKGETLLPGLMDTHPHGAGGGPGNGSIEIGKSAFAMPASA